LDWKPEMYVQAPPPLDELIAKLVPDRFREVLATRIRDAEYLHWDKLRHLAPPEGLTHEEWWLLLKLSRNAARRELPLTSPEGRVFSYGLPDCVLRLLHLVDQRTSGEIAMEEVVTADAHAKRRYLVNSLMEEAIRSSQLEGATTSRRVAKELLQTGREPVDRSERMILNNYRALQFMREGIGDELTPEAVLELHRVVTEGTLDDPDAAGRLQRPGDERVAVYDRDDHTVLHRPPPAEQLPERLEAMCVFANARATDDQFLHPVVRALVLHFWVGYDHPFEDGNGRTARALFYWAMKREGYWLAEYLSISKILREAPSRYARSFLLSETDDGDLTYFLLDQLQVIERAVDELHGYLRRKVAEVQEIEVLLRDDSGLNHRQIALLGHALRNVNAVYTFGGHAASHGVTHETARADLLGLHERKLLERRRSGRQYRFMAPADLLQRLRAPSTGRPPRAPS
jgi:Fic family protein